MKDEQQGDILYYDSDCGFCSKSVQFILKRTSAKQLMIAPLNGLTAKSNLDSNLLEIDSLILQRKDKIYAFSSAAIRSISRCKGLYKLFIIFLVVPPFIRNWIYRLIARNRKRILTDCQLNPELYKNRVLD